MMRPHAAMSSTSRTKATAASRGSWFYHSNGNDDEAMFLHMACAKDLATCNSYTFNH